MNSRRRANKIESYGKDYSRLLNALESLPGEMRQFRDEHGCWSVHEHLIHIVDSEVNSYIRCRRLIAEPGKDLMAYDENVWASSLRYHEQDIEDALTLFRWLRRKTYTLIKSLPEEVWGRSARHPENGEMTLDDWLDVYVAHVPEHIQYMRENHEAWLKTRA